MDISRIDARIKELIKTKSINAAGNNKSVMYNEKIEALIDIALEDGVLTDKERNILLKKAQESGIDPDEFEMVLDSRVAKLNKGNMQSVSNVGSGKIRVLFKQLEELELEKQSTTGIISGRIKSFVADDDDDYSERLTQKKRNLIQNFPLPTSKEDILEFLSLAIPLAKKKGNAFIRFIGEDTENEAHNELVPAWKSKCEQIVTKAKFSMKNNPEVLQEILDSVKDLGIK